LLADKILAAASTPLAIAAAASPPRNPRFLRAASVNASMSAALKRPGTRTASMCVATETARVTHSFNIVGNGLHKNFGVGRCIRSAPFSAGGHNWCIHYYPDGNTEDDKDYVSVFLELMSKNTEARSLLEFRLVNQTTGISTSVFTCQAVHNATITTWGRKKFMKKDDLETLGYLKDECLEIECDLTVIKWDDIDLPPSDLQDNLGKLLESGEGMDVTFKVKNELFRAHKIVLKMRSPVFNAELTRDKRKRIIIVEDIEPPVFKALLRFIYTDSLPSMGDLDGNENDEIVRHLLVAANRYGLVRMKLMCESILCNRLAVQDVAATLAAADQCCCYKLKDACIQFINSSYRIVDVATSQGFEDLKKACPALIAEICEKAAMPHKI
jgi:speckle-type POZ protein